jgi:hypothetical protein
LFDDFGDAHVFEVLDDGGHGRRVLRNTHAPLTLPGTLSTAGHWDQSRVAIVVASCFIMPQTRRPHSCAMRLRMNGAPKMV